MAEQRTQVIWFKRDLRVYDHACLTGAATKGPVLAMLVVEPEYWALPETSWRQFELLRQAIASLQEQLKAIGGRLLVWTGDAVCALEALNDELGPFDLWAHQETGNFWTFQRDVLVREWCASRSVPFAEPVQYGVWRGSRLNRDRWAKDWDALMSQPILERPNEIAWSQAAPKGFARDRPTDRQLGLKPDGIEGIQPGGRNAALATLRSFLTKRGQEYRTDMSSPSPGATGCSRLSVHLVAGSVSMRECYQATVQRIEELQDDTSAEAKAWRASLKSFIGRLHWHCHFMQKLETEPEMEFRPVARVYEGMRPAASPEWHAAYAEGRTGYPFVDACLRSLIATGWINFRMRAMLMSFACYDLFMPWQEAGAILGRLFTDYEAGIHWTQSLMQSGETGINTLRIYSPVKQGRDHDPDGKFIRRWVPELKHLTGNALHEPWKHGGAECYPDPIVDHAAATKAARDAIWAIRRTPEAKAEAEDVLLRHGSRRRPRSRMRAKTTSNAKKAKA
ncbi:FAD-binding domain-containing protein [Altererythrobacter sp.]|nr:FAD-binding domain-containing protein [Altererythrobacter sp.]